MKLASFTNSEYGIKSEVWQTDTGYNVVVKDIDAKKTLPTITIYDKSVFKNAKAKAMAMKKAFIFTR